MKKKEDIEVIKFALQEVKDHYNLVLESFNDIRGKNQILLFVCSLLLTLPLSNDFIVKKLVYPNDNLTILFIAGIISLSIAILSLIWSMFDTKINIPEIKSVRDSIGKFEQIGIMKAVLDKYIKDLDFNQEQIENKRMYIRQSEKFILVGIVLILIPIVLILKEGVI